MAWLQVLCVTIALLIGFVDVANSSTCPTECHCVYVRRSAVCGKHKHGLTYIPAVPAYVRHFTLLNANIPTVNRSVLQPISNQSLHSLTLNSDNITTLSDDSFTYFQDLIFLDLSKNRIELLKIAFRSLGYRLRTLLLQNMNIQYIPKDIIPENKTLNIKNIDLNHNRLRLFDESLFARMPKLTKLDLSYNDIELIKYNVTLKGKLRIKNLNLGYNSLKSIPSFCWSNGTSRYYRLECLNLDGNKIQSIYFGSSLCLHTVKWLTANANPINVLMNNTFSRLPRLQTLQLMNLPKLKTIEELAFNSTSIKILLLCYNREIKESTFPGDFPFKWASGLKSLNLQRTRIKLSSNLLRSMLLQLKSVTYLNLQKTWIYTLPPDTLGKLPNLNHLDLQGNYLSRWDERTFSNVTHLQYLNLDGCRISIINETSFPVEMRKTIKAINLGNNPFFCTCDLLWFRTWMTEVIRNNSIRFVNYPQKYFCKNRGRIALEKYNPTYIFCTPMRLFIIVAACCCFLGFLIIVVSSIVYRNRWNIRYCVYSWRRRQYQKIPGRDVEFKYDCFVSCDSRDMDWMMTEVHNFLQNELELRLCIPGKDFEGGKMIIDNIMDCMEQSKKIILIISKNFVSSNWCQCEVQIALDEYFRNHKDVVVIVREMVEKRFMFKSLKALIDSTTYIEWEDDIIAKKVFTLSLAEAMGCEHANR